MSSKLLSHKNYLGSIEVSLEDNCLHGQVLFVNDLITYEGESPSELEESFRAAVDNYLDTCEREGLNPDKPCSGTFNVRLTPEMHRRACITAIERRQSLNEFVKECVSLGISDKSPTIQITENHTHVHNVPNNISNQSNEYDEEEIAPWQPIESKVKHQRRAH
ncbi:MAG TPA: type II toxin-antitoxin system HicB family antitoxin [Burkholderiaceae bacterium]|nr:type II toxin-antitoxin system HicB family antitoxin [Burkholderiaceae bacterium]